jgi:Tfp pilus assembly protein PilO
MDFAMMENLISRLQAFVGSLGAAGVIGLGLLVFGAAFYASSVAPARDELTRLETRAARAAAGNAQNSTGAGDAIASSVEQLEKFQKRFPAFGDAPALVLKLHTIAAANGLVLETGEYQLVRERDSNVMRYQITLPLKGSYPQVRLFLAQLLDEVPALSLDEIAIKREAVNARSTETRVRLTAYLVD